MQKLDDKEGNHSQNPGNSITFIEELEVGTLSKTSTELRLCSSDKHFQ